MAGVCRSLSRLGLGFVHLVEPIAGPCVVASAQRLAPIVRANFNGTLILNGGYSAATAEDALTHAEGDLVSFATPFIANPDLVERFAAGAPLASADPATLYGGEERGYIDYPRMERTRLSSG
jgi:N-ethylmaleimide reductase